MVEQICSNHQQNEENVLAYHGTTRILQLHVATNLNVPIMGILSHFGLFLRLLSLLFEVFQLLMATNAYKCLEMPTNALKCLKMPTNIHKCSQIPTNTHEYPQMPTNAYICPQMRTRVVELSIYLARMVENTKIQSKLDKNSNKIAKHGPKYPI